MNGSSATEPEPAATAGASAFTTLAYNADVRLAPNSGGDATGPLESRRMSATELPRAAEDFHMFGRRICHFKSSNP